MEKIKSLIMISAEADYVVRDLTPNEIALFQSVFLAAKTGVIIECSRFDDVIEKCWNEWQMTKPLRYDVLRQIVYKNHKAFFVDYSTECDFIFDSVKNKLTA